MTHMSNDTDNNVGAKSGGFMRKFAKKTLASLAAVATLAGGMAVGVSTAEAANAPTTSYDRTLGNPTFEAARESYGLSKEMSYGSILHAWMWSFNTIKNNMKDIAEAGYTSVQTSPISTIKGPEHGTRFYENWYYVYQPSGTGIGNKVVGTEDELKAMTAEAHKYGVRVIVDGVINHFTSDWNAIDSEWRRSDYFHNRSDCGGQSGDSIDYNNRWQVTHCHLLGLWDLNTENQEVGNKMAAFLKQAVADGVDGFRYDAAKHIELPNEMGWYSPYYDTILPNGAQYQYGEVLQGDAGLNVAAYPALFKQYSSNGGGNTASAYGKDILRPALWDKNLSANRMSDWKSQGMANNEMVTWVESHDTYANNDKESTSMSAWQIRMGWGIIGARAAGAPLFFNRPVGSGGSGPQFAETTGLGDAGDNEWKSPEVVAVNHFRNAMEGNAEYLRNCNGNNNCLMIERYKSDGNANNDGVVVVNLDGDKNLAGMDTVLDNGTYTDEVSGSTLTVSNKKITSGSVQSGKVAVFYNASTGPRASVSITGSKTFKTDTTQVTLNARNVTNARYTTSEGASGSFSDGQKITIGANTAAGNTITVTINATAEDGSAVTATETFLKKDPNAVVSYTAYAKKPSSWSKIYAYVYVDDNGPAGSTVTQNAVWPGELMTAESNACNGTADYVYEIPEDIIDKAGDNPIRVIFNNGGDGSITGNKFPADTVTSNPDDHVDAAGLLIDGTYVWDGNITSGKWSEAACVAVTVDSIAINGGNLTLDVNDSPTAKLTTTITPSTAANAKVTWTSSNTSVATVSNGTVQAVKAGTATITATAGGKSASITVTVTGVRVAPTTTTVYYPSSKFGANSTYFHWRFVGAAESTWTTAPGVKMTQACDGYVSVTIDNPDQKDLEFVFNNGNNTWDNVGGVSGKNYTAGGENVVITDNSGKYGTVAPCVVEVPVSSVTISGGNATLTEGETKTLSATVAPANATDRAVSWSSSNAAVASVDASGTVTAKKAGTATITATAGGKSATTTITVKAAASELQSISITGAGVANNKLTMTNGTTKTLSVVANPSDAQVGVVTWMSSDSSVAAIDGNGKITAKKTGVAAITAVASGKVANLIVTVEQGGVVNPVTGTFSDVPRGISFFNEIEWMAANGISKGYSDGRFGYYDNLNRQDMAIFLYRLAKLNNVGNAASYSPSTADYNKFSDVNKGSYAAKEILWLAKNGITQGSNGKFNGTSKLTRQDMAIFLYRFAKLAGSSSANSFSPSTADYNKFSDVNKGTFAAKEILWLAKEGITLGNSNGTFGGSSKLTRSAMAAFMYRTHNHINK